jgi:hypothetical protein
MYSFQNGLELGTFEPASPSSSEEQNRDRPYLQGISKVNPYSLAALITDSSRISLSPYSDPKIVPR